ncbi:MAG TPA: hypothetical protein VFL88_05360 [Gemmatimonadales bacterium]|nr:hypothetical protein [Gemmatimonadales bacterium]
MRASAPAVLGLLCALVACGGPPPVATTGPVMDTTGSTLGTLPLAGIFQLESTGAPPPDTTVTTRAGLPRTIVLRHAPPDNVMFAEVAFDSAAFQVPAGQEVEIQVTPRPGAYGLTLRTSAPFSAASITFAYPVHFFAPAGARTRYGSDIEVERVLAIARLEGDVATFLPSVRPATDQLRTIVERAGTYLVAAPR